MTTQRTFATALSSVLGFVLISQVLLPGQASADSLRSDAQQVAMSQAGALGLTPLATDDDPWH
jgi:hypothetical protein